MYAESTGLVAGSGDDTTAAAMPWVSAYNNRFAFQLCSFSYFAGGEERIHVYVEDYAVHIEINAGKFL